MNTPARSPDTLNPEPQAPALTPLKAHRAAFAGTLFPDERAAVLEAFKQAQLGRPSVAVRIVLMAFARSAEVCDAVARWARTHPEVR